MNLLFIGDSIVRGTHGVSFVDKIANRFPTYKITNLGRNGANHNLISSRLIDHLTNNANYDYIFLEGGGGDAWMPSFKEKGKLFAFAHRVQLKKGNRPEPDATAFYKALKTTINAVKKIYTGNIVLLTNACLGEKPDTPLNIKLQAFNAAIKQVALEDAVLLADTGNAIATYLSGKPLTDYLCEDFFSVTYFDPLIAKLPTGADYLSKKRNLFVTIDGVHLNNTGADIFANCIMGLLTEK